MSSKVELRQHFRKLRMSIEPELRQAWDKEITRQVLAIPKVQQAQVIFSYLDNWGEVSTKEILNALLEQGKLVFVPSPSHRALPDEGCHLLSQIKPIPLTEACPDEVSQGRQVDVYLVPGIAWCRKGYRVGFGGGYFDRLLAGRNSNSLTIGLAYGLQAVDSVPIEPWDQQVDLLVTESGVLKTRD